ncbi:hypothetical protein [Companilactobacillus musae]|nr:hypothetical protein [Companilactobacillus musae]
MVITNLTESVYAFRRPRNLCGLLERGGHNLEPLGAAKCLQD